MFSSLIAPNCGIQALAALPRCAAVRPLPKNDVVPFVGMASGAVGFGGIALKLIAARPTVVLLLGDGLKVLRAYTERVVAKVVDCGFVRNRPLCHEVAVPMGQPRFAVCAKLAVATGKPVGRPVPAISGLFNLRPKPFFRRTYDLLGAHGHERVAMAVPAPVVHSAPTALFSGVLTFGNGALHA